MYLHVPLGVKTTQVRNPKRKGSPTKINSIELPNTEDWVSENSKNAHAEKFAVVFNRLGRSKNHVVTTQFFSPLIPIQEKGRRIPVHILDRMEKEIDKLQANKQIRNLDKYTNDIS